MCTVTAAFGFGCRSTAPTPTPTPTPPPPPPPPPPLKGRKVFSKYFGVGFNARKRKWTAMARHNGEHVNIGQAFATEMEAVNAVDKWLREHNRAAEANLDESGNFVPRVVKESSEFTGVTWSKKSNKWHAQIKVAGKMEHLGYFDDEEEAARAFDTRAAELNRPTNFDVHGQRCLAGVTAVPPPQPAVYNVPSPAEITRCFGTSSVS